MGAHDRSATARTICPGFGSGPGEAEVACERAVEGRLGLVAEWPATSTTLFGMEVNSRVERRNRHRVRLPIDVSAKKCWNRSASTEREIPTSVASVAPVLAAGAPARCLRLDRAHGMPSGVGVRQLRERALQRFHEQCFG